MAIQAHIYSDQRGATQQQQQQQPLMMMMQNLSHHHKYDDHKNIIDFQQSLSFPLHIQNQKLEEMDQFINLQNERLRIALHEQRKQQISSLVKKYESKTQFLIKQKDEEILKASNRTMELQNHLTRMEMENQSWQRVAIENESMVASLKSTIERLRESVCISGNAAEDAESCCVEEERENDEDKRRRKMGTVCKSCKSRDSCVIMLPCRHLCSCTNCDAFLHCCPVCNVLKKASIQAFI